MQNRTQKKIRRLLAGMLGAVLLLTGCTQSQQKQADVSQAVNESGAQGGTTVSTGPVAKGRYVEQEIPWAENHGGNMPVALLPKADGLYLLDAYYTDAEVKLARADFSNSSEMPQIYNIDSATLPKVLQDRMKAEDYITDMVMAENGARMYTVFTFSKTEEQRQYFHDKYFMDAEGNEVPWDGGGSVSREDMVVYTYGYDGCFYVYNHKRDEEGGALYRVNAADGETKYLMDLDFYAWNINVFGGKLFAGNDEGLHIYDLTTLQKLEEDTGLTELVKERLGVSNGNYATGFLLYPGEDESVYVATDKGLYRHILYGNVSELLIDGTLCSLGDISKLFTDMYVEENENGMPVFYFLYDNLKLMRFSYDPEMPSVPEKTIHLYSLNENSDVRLAITAYQSLHPEVYVLYEVGMSGDDGVTREDALNSLATRIASGEGPDIFLMDNLPLRSYANKGVLMDLSGLYGDLKSEQQYFDNIVSALYTGEKLYTIPMLFHVPMLAGDAKILSGITDVESMVKAIEDYRMPKSGLRAGLIRPEATLQCMSYTHSGSWLKQDGSLDREALTEFLTICKKLYEADRADISQEDLDYRMDITEYTTDIFNSHYFVSRQMGSMVMNRRIFGDAFAIGDLGGEIKYEFNYFYAVLKQIEGTDYMLLPGRGNTCMPEAMLAVNAATTVPEEACAFVKYMLSDYLEDTELLSGIPISRAVLLDMEKNPFMEENDPWGAYSYHSLGTPDGEIFQTEVAWQQENVYAQYNKMLDSIDSVNCCEYELLNAVLTGGAPALTGEKTIEETVDEIAKKVQIYLAE